MTLLKNIWSYSRLYKVKVLVSVQTVPLSWILILLFFSIPSITNHINPFYSIQLKLITLIKKVGCSGEYKKKNYTLDIFFELETCKCIFCCKSFDAALLSYRSTDYSPDLTQTTPIMHQPQFLVSTSLKVKQDLRDICQGSK